MVAPKHVGVLIKLYGSEYYICSWLA